MSGCDAGLTDYCKEYHAFGGWPLKQQSARTGGLAKGGETLRQQHRTNWAAIQTIISLLDEVESLREKLRWRR